jgi:antitoxin component HigA of HigAB toxin-antitoxin module
MEQLTQQQYQQALYNVRNLMKLKPSKDSPQGKELEALISAIENYEDKYVPMTSSKERKG